MAKCVEKTSLGNHALFLGDNASVTVDASTFSGIKANCIYYTNNFKRGGGKYTGILIAMIFCPQESKDYILVVIYSGSLAFWRPGDKCWTHVQDDICSFCDIIFHKGLFYGVIDRGRVFAFDAWGSNLTRTYFFRHGPDEYSSGFNRPYIVESAGEILTIFLKVKQSICYNKDDSRVDYRICGFKVFEVDLSDAEECLEETSLGNNALFLGDNASISADARGGSM
ncbi:hypothetical protein Vadar_012616 [Vaccinium darrowii]|uniref:Uncharacterized protein n=1 Tax=Vaccinium darrowii TaxID=229202 RepID=A0ACB7XHF1_9ERIC|nr:hypothetical protein Vadar_012616 [Vaccinium darrowii]